MADLVQFDDESGARIGRVVREVEGQVRRARPLVFAPLLESSGGGDTVRLCKTGGSFAKGTVADLNVWEEGTPPNETQNDPTVTLHDVVNKYANIAADKWVSVAKHGNGYWYVISAECG